MSKTAVHEVKHTDNQMRFVVENLLQSLWGADVPVGHLMVHDVKALTSKDYKGSHALFTRPPSEYLIRPDVDGVECVVIMAVINDEPSILIHSRQTLQIIKHIVVPMSLGGDDAMFHGTVLLGVFVTQPGSAKQSMLYITDIAVSLGLRFVKNEKATYERRLSVRETFKRLLAPLLTEQDIVVDVLPTTSCGSTAYSKIREGTTSTMTGLVFTHKDSILTASTEVFVWQSLFTVVLAARDNKWWCIENGSAIDVKVAVKSTFKPMPREMQMQVHDGVRVTFKIKCTDTAKQEFEFTPIAVFSGQMPVSTTSALQTTLTACRDKLQWSGVMKELVQGDVIV